jgi:hypothetical protein
MRKQALSLIGTFAVVIATSIVASAALDASSESNSHVGGARLSSTKHGQERDHGRAASAKPLDNVTGTPCDSYYTMYGGSRAEYRGRYNKGSASMSCNGNAVYIQDDTSCSNCPHYLIYTGSRWWVVSHANMLDCKNTGYIESANDCTCPERCTDPCTGCGAFGAWQENTGKNGGGGTINTATCNADVWCDSGIWWV